MNDPISILLRASVHQFIGRAGKDPEIRYLESGKCVANVDIGINKLGNRDEESDWIKLEVWGESGQAFADQVRKGYLISVAGRIKTDRWTDRSTGEERMQLCCRVESWKVVSTPRAPGQAAPPAAAAPAAVAPAPAQHPAYAAAGHQPAPAPAPQAPPAWQSSDEIPF